jgi:hypothetical protein
MDRANVVLAARALPMIMMNDPIGKHSGCHSANMFRIGKRVTIEFC